MILDDAYWTNRYKTNQIGWDAGSITTPLKEYFDQLEDKNMSILIPGAGNAYEAGYLVEQDFTNVWIVDFSEEPLKNFKAKYPLFDDRKLLKKDFFDLEGEFDLMIEQTFFCAIDRKLRLNYASQAAKLLKPGGKFVGLFWKEEWVGGPPFGGSAEEYRKAFEPYFHIKVLETSYNSIKPRAERELFLNLIKK